MCLLKVICNNKSSLVLLALAASVQAQETVGDMPPLTPSVQRCVSLGSAGLLAEFGSYGTFGAVQNRIGQSRAEIEASRAVALPLWCYKDSVDQLIVPVDVFTPLAGSSTSFLKLAGSANLARSHENVTQLDVDTRRAEAEYLWSPTPAGLFGLGVFAENTDVDMRQNAGRTEDRGHGLRADVLRVFGEHWGIAARAEQTWTEREMRLPLGPGRALSYNQDLGRFYSQADLVGRYTKDSLGWLPSGWVFHPALGGVYQHTRFEDARNNFGGLVSGTVGADDEYLALSGSVRFESMAFRPWRPAPYVELGLEREFVNDLNGIVDEPNIAHTAVGFSMNLGFGCRLDLEYGRYDGFSGKRRAQSLTVHVGKVF